MRLAIWQGMGIVLLVALDLAVTRVPLSGRPVTEALLLMGGLPMANLLVVSGLVLIRGFGERDRLRPALIGFAVNGCAMLAIVATAAIREPLRLLESVRQTLTALEVPGGPNPLTATLALSILQLGLALLGGWAGRKLGSKFFSRPGPAVRFIES